jgi:hypothetical protein
VIHRPSRTAAAGYSGIPREMQRASRLRHLQDPSMSRLASTRIRMESDGYPICLVSYEDPRQPSELVGQTNRSKPGNAPDAVRSVYALHTPLVQ